MIGAVAVRSESTEEKAHGPVPGTTKAESAGGKGESIRESG